MKRYILTALRFIGVVFALHFSALLLSDYGFGITIIKAFNYSEMLLLLGLAWIIVSPKFSEDTDS